MIRPLGAGDLAGLRWLDDGTRAGLAAALRAGEGCALVLVAAADHGVPVGVLAVDLPPWRERTDPWVWVVAVEPGSRGRGVGAALLGEAHRRLQAAGHAAVELSVDDGNARAAALYRRLGYRVVGRGADHGPAGPEPWTRMRRPLDR